MKLPLLSLALALTLAACAGNVDAPPAARSMPIPTGSGPQFCAQIQQVLAGTPLIAQNSVQATFEAFVKSKPQIKPLQTQQYVEYADPARTRPMLIACKTKSADHIKAIHGSDQALDDRYDCRSINSRLLSDAWAALSASEQSAARWPLARIVLDDDDVGFMGASFVKPYTFLYLGADGLPHLKAKAQYASWEDWRFKWMPERFRGTHYCRLIAPEYAKQLLLGTATLAPLPAS